jgi:hypothetical protein
MIFSIGTNWLSARDPTKTAPLQDQVQDQADHKFALILPHGLDKAKIELDRLPVAVDPVGILSESDWT